MIDTDKYEGHTPGPWKLAEGDPYDDEACWMNIVSENAGPRYGFAIQECVGFSDVPEGTPDVRLMVDAPLLLAEVKRLREYKNKLEYALDLCASKEIDKWIDEQEARIWGEEE